MIADLVPVVRSALGVDASYDAVVIPRLLNRAINRLLRDYHFPKSVVRTDFSNLSPGDKEFVLPAGFKKELLVHFRDNARDMWSEPMKKREAFQLPNASGAPYYYWLQGNSLVLDTPVSSEMNDFDLHVYHESMSPTVNEAWITEDFPSAVEYRAILQGGGEIRKPEVSQTYTPLWADERESLAIYLNELEWSNVEMFQRESAMYTTERYPA